MIKCLVYYLILGLLLTNCGSGKAVVLQNPQTDKTISQNAPGLSKEIFILIGRGGCCHGHMFSINKDGEIKYLVGTYSIPNDKGKMPEIYDPQLVTSDLKYQPKKFKLSPEKVKSLESLINHEQDLRYNDDIEVTDDYIYNIYLDNIKIAAGYQSRKNKFHRNLKALIDFIHGEVEMYELPGMA